MGYSRPLQHETLARRLGEVSHVSPLLHRIQQVSGCQENQLGDWLLKAAVERGASHYQKEFEPTLPPDSQAITTEEIGVALCAGSLPFNLMNIRAAAQLLSSPSIDAPRLVHLARMERIEPLLLHIAAIASRFEPTAHPWAFIRQNLKTRRTVKPDALPHWTRLTSHTGITPFGGPPSTKWLYRKETVK